MIPKPARSASRTATIALVSRWRRLRRMRSRVQLQPSPCSMKSRDISAMPSASARVAKRIEAAGGALLIGAFCDKRRAPETAPRLRRKWQEMHPRRGCMPVQLSDGPADRPPRHGRVLCVGRAAPLSRAARPRRRHRRRPRQPAEEARRRQPRVQLAAPLRRPRRRHDQHLRSAQARRLLGDGNDEVGAARTRRDPAAGRLRRIPQVLAPLQGRRARDRAGHRGPRHRRDLRRPERRARRARRRRARDRQRHQGGGARAHRPDLLDRHHAEQAALEARLRARQARRPDAARPRRRAGAHLAARRAQGERHRPEGRGAARRAAASRRSATSPPPIRPSCSLTSARASVPGCTRRRTAATSVRS